MVLNFLQFSSSKVKTRTYLPTLIWPILLEFGQKSQKKWMDKSLNVLDKKTVCNQFFKDKKTWILPHGHGLSY